MLDGSQASFNKRTRFLNLDEMKRFRDTLGALEAGAANAKAIAIMRLWALTGCRRDEIAGLKWSEVDFGRACLTLAETKTGRSIRPLAHAASAILTAQPRDVSSEDVFPSDDNTACQRRSDIAAAGRINSAAVMRTQEGPFEGVFLRAARHS